MRSSCSSLVKLLPILLALTVLAMPGFRIDSGMSSKERSITCLKLSEFLFAAPYAASKDLVGLAEQKPAPPNAYFGGISLVDRVKQRDGGPQLGNAAGLLLPRTTLVGVVVLRI